MSLVKKILLFFCLLNSSLVFSESLSPWLLTVSTGKEEGPFSVSQTIPFKELTKTIYPIPFYNLTFNQVKKIKITYIGKINDAKIYDVIYQFDPEFFIKAIFLERLPDRFVPVYYGFIDRRYVANSFATISPSFILTDSHVLVSELQLSGTGGYIDSFYLYIPPDILKNKQAIPQQIDTSIINKILNKHLPKNYYAPTGHAFDIKTLHFHSCITKTALHCFAGKWEGIVDMQFTLHEGKLKLKSFSYDRAKPDSSLRSE